MTYNKKQMKPLIDKYQINPETNKLFESVIDLFDGQPNYQLWGVKMIFSQVLSFDDLKTIKKWAEENQNMISKLERQNIVSYSSKTAINKLWKEFEGIKMISFIKDIISHFNTDQRKMLTDALNENGNLTPLEAYSNSMIKKWYKVFKNFSKKSLDRKNKFYSTCSAVRDIDTLFNLIDDFLSESYIWDKDDFLSFVEHNTKDCKVIFNEGDVVILQIPSYESSHKLGFGRTQWCLCREPSYFNSYVTTYGGRRKQYFLFDFNRKETDCFAHIGFTVERGYGIVEAQTCDNKPMVSDFVQGDEVMNINGALSKVGANMSLFLEIQENKNFKWDEKSVLKFISECPNYYAVAYNKNGYIIINILDHLGLEKLTENTYIRCENFAYPTQDTKLYVFLDLNVPYYDENSMIAMQYTKDNYGIFTKVRSTSIFGNDITNYSYLTELGITSNDYLNHEAIDPSILLHKLIDENDEAGAIELIEKEGNNVDINFEFNERVPIYTAINNRMENLFKVIVNHPRFDSNTNDGFGETILESLIYLYGSEEVLPTKEEEKMLVDMIKAILESSHYNFNAVDINNSTALNFACEFENEVWIVEKLVSNKNVNVNSINDFGCSALSNCITNNNIEALKILGQRPDLVVQASDYDLAKEFHINLDDFIKPNYNIYNHLQNAESLEYEFSTALV